MKERWIQIIRQKAHEYEHPARSNGESVMQPDLDQIAWEIEAFFEGLEK